ncbi:putative nucleotidyltransferase, ribonuclease H [Tanacetum coccineum]
MALRSWEFRRAFHGNVRRHAGSRNLHMRCGFYTDKGNFKDPAIVYRYCGYGAVSNSRFQPELIAILPVFRGREEPYAHLREFFSIADTYQAWFTSLEPGSIHSWSEMQSAFLDEFYSISKTAAIRNKIKSFRQIPGEQFHEAFNRLKELLRTCPHHDIPKWELVKVFYDGLDYQNQQFVMATSGGTFFSRRTHGGRNELLKVSKGSKTQASVDRNNHTSLTNFVSNQHGTNSEISELSKKVDLLLRNLGKVVYRNVSQISTFFLSPPPASLVDKYDLGTLRKTDTIISLADRSTKIPRGILEDVIVKVDDFYYPVDFFVMDTESPYKDVQPTIILGRPSSHDLIVELWTMDIALSRKHFEVGITVVETKSGEKLTTRPVTGWRVCIDYRKLEYFTSKDHFPLPFIDQIVEKLSGQKFYCFLDGYFEDCVLALCHAPDYFQRCMMSIFSDMVGESVEIFMDDFSIFGQSFESYLGQLECVLKRCTETNLVLSWEKSHFMVREGIVLGRSYLKKDLRLTVPRRFIKDFSAISKPLCNLLLKDARFDFNESCLKAIHMLKHKLCRSPILQSPDLVEAFRDHV